MSCCIVAGGYNAAADTASLAMDYRLVGFRECAAEVSRYLVSIEGMDLQDPLRLRLIGHLQCYSGSAQRDAKACGGGPLSVAGVGTGPSTAPPPPPPPPPHPWNPQPHHHHQYGPGAPGTAPMTMHNPAVQYPAVGFDQPGAATAGSYLEALGRGPAAAQGHGTQHQHGVVDGIMRLSSHNTSSQLNSPVAGSVSPSAQQSAAAASLFGVHHAAQFLGAMNTMPPVLSPNGLHYGSTSAMLAQGVKPYRPWGAELAY